MKKLFTTARVALLVLLAAPATARATTILDITTQLSSSDATQLGRLSRDGVPSDWSTTKTFPGELNTTTPYFYETFVVNVGDTPFIQIDFDSDTAFTFASAYLGSYNPLSKSTNYLGDAGFSGNPFPSDPNFFQVQVPLFSDLVIVVNSTVAAPSGGFEPFRLMVEGFIDANYDEPAATTPVPEPATLLLGASGMALMGLRRRLRQRA